jgi:hypothetical protein
MKIRSVNCQNKKQQSGFWITITRQNQVLIIFALLIWSGDIYTDVRYA